MKSYQHGSRFEAGRTPGKFETLPAPEETSVGANRGQILIMFAIFTVGLFGVLGLATDVGYAMAARRAAQGAADAGALAGARKIAQYTSGTTVQAEVNTVVTSNKFGPGITSSLYRCEYIGNNWGVVGTCNQAVPWSAVGTRVRTRVSFNTFFMQIIPGAPENLTASAYAKARVERASLTAPDAPFIICGTDSWAVKNAAGATIDQNIPILDSNNNIRSAAVGVTYRVHEEQLWKNYNADCGLKDRKAGADFKGLGDQDTNENKSVPDWFDTDHGNKVGPTRAKVNGTEGCAANTPSPYNCVMILPIATDESPGKKSDQLYVVGYAAFKITKVGNSHNAQLLDDYIMSGPGTPDWCRDCGGAVVIRLIW